MRKGRSADSDAVNWEEYSMPRTSIFDMPFSKVYEALVNKAVLAYGIF